MRIKTIYEKVQTKKMSGASYGMDDWEIKWITLQSGRRIMYSDAIRELSDSWSSVVRWLSRSLKLTGEEYDDERLLWRIEEMDTVISWYKMEIEKRVGQKPVKEKIALLRNTEGRTAEEAAAFLKKADELERGLE